MHKLDPFRLDRTLARFARQHARFQALLAEGAGAEHAFEFCPPELDLELLHELRDAGDRDPIAEPASRWLGFLLLEHACIAPALRVAESLHRAQHPLDRPERGSFSWAEMRRRALIDAPRREGWLFALESRAKALQTSRFELFERRAERAAELGVAAVTPLAALPQAAQRCLELSAEAYRELAVASLPRLLEAGLGRSVPGTYPTRLTLRALSELLREGNWFSGLEPELLRTPEMWGASSVLRALGALGRALHDAGASSRQPFVVAHDPHGLRGELFASLFALLPLNPEFAARRLSISRSRFADYRRALAGVVLLALRVECVRVELAESSLLGTRSYHQAFRERIPDAFGFELPETLAGTLWVDDRAPIRLSALLAALLKNAELTHSHDQDWFRNPRAVEELRAEFESPPTLSCSKQQLERGLELLAELARL